MTSMLRACALAAALLLTGIGATQAADRTVTLKLGAGSTLGLERAFKTVMIGDPRVVEVRTYSDRSVILEPLSVGATNLVFVDDKSIAISNVRILVCNAGAIRVSYQEEAGCD
jgi:Flp pilus assembly secretin CpaC